MAHQSFTLESAESLLPRLSELLSQMQGWKREHDRLQDRVSQFEQQMKSDGHLLEQELGRTRQELARAAAEVNSLIERVQELGCELKDIDQGLVDFRTEMEGREVYLCWKLGEPAIAWWHDLESGFAGRRPLPGRP